LQAAESRKLATNGNKNIFITKKIILACLLATTAASAVTEWTEMGETETLLRSKSQGFFYV
jgi:hypothetical protein